MSVLSSHRTPISILQEVCVKKAITPRYELVSSEGPIHEPHYVFLCTAGPFSATSKGVSKKKAKHQGSYLILLQMMNSPILTDSEKAALRDLHMAAANVLGSDFLDSLQDTEYGGLVDRFKHDDEGNFVGQLQDICHTNMWPPPTYEFATVPMPHSGNEYSCKVTVWKWTHTGFGSSKKIAKRRAACELLESILKNNLNIPQETLEGMEEENLSFIDKSDQAGLRDTKQVNEAAVRIASRALKGLWNKKGNKLQIPLAISDGQDLSMCDKLEKMAEALKITVVYSYLNETRSGKIHCIAELSTIPPHVVKSPPCTSLESARESAAERCILFLHVMSSANPRMNYSDWFRDIPNSDCTQAIKVE